MANKIRQCEIDPKLYTSSICRGPPGTEEDVGKLFYDLGFPLSDEVVTCCVINGISQHLGGTGPKLISQFELGLGQVRFINEVYSLIEDSFHKDAMAEIFDKMTNPRYVRNMVVSSRIRLPTIINFPRMAPEHFLHLLSNSLAKLDIGISKSITEHGGHDNTTIRSILEVLVGTE